MLNNKLADYNPYATPGNTGSVKLAEAAMKGSKYDTNNDGKCDVASACQNVLMVADSRAVDQGMVPIIIQDAKEDRHHLQGAVGCRRLQRDQHAEEQRGDLDPLGLG